ncbi:MAG: hypothetical protein ACI935_003830 [Moritella dasanensis]|jgi:hypothetical protein
MNIRDYMFIDEKQNPRLLSTKIDGGLTIIVNHHWPSITGQCLLTGQITL